MTLEVITLEIGEDYADAREERLDPTASIVLRDGENAAQITRTMADLDWYPRPSGEGAVDWLFFPGAGLTPAILNATRTILFYASDTAEPVTYNEGRPTPPVDAVYAPWIFFESRAVNP